MDKQRKAHPSLWPNEIRFPYQKGQKVEFHTSEFQKEYAYMQSFIVRFGSEILFATSKARVPEGASVLNGRERIGYTRGPHFVRLEGKEMSASDFVAYCLRRSWKVGVRKK
jgi:hypothetical protein